MSKSDKIVIGTRGSQLALWQARTVAAQMQEATGTACEIVVIKTTGDRIQDRTLMEAGGKGLFTQELETELLSGQVQAAVHSLKDLPGIFSHLPLFISLSIHGWRRANARM